MKHIHRFFTDERITSGQTVRLSSDDAFHASRVLRLRPGDQLELAGADGRAFQAKVSGAGSGFEAVVGDEIGMEPQPALALTVVQAMPRGRKMDLVVEKLSEIGVTGLVPVYSQASVAKPKPGGGEKLERWRRIARSSASQAKRDRVMDVADPRALAGWLDSWEGSLIALATEVDAMPLGEAAAMTAAPLALLIGPEAGFSEEELRLLQDHGATFASLGRLVLRTETAALVSAAIVMHRLGGLG
ncbi:MAG: 16S rRNA (uracil(1498)-N(3))-methyltransferase [Actinobacteria bacterium]|nr:16S rRNA (uracil(1498)-N(3))-methyltransferase [Actinomycetota bacterium]